MPLVPQRERKQSPELPAPVLISLYVLVEQPRHRLVVEETLPPERVRRQRVACERLELATQPRRGGDREPALPPVDDLLRQQRLDGLSQQHLLAQTADLVSRRQREGESSDDRIEERHARLERVRH